MNELLRSLDPFHGQTLEPVFDVVMVATLGAPSKARFTGARCIAVTGLRRYYDPDLNPALFHSLMHLKSEEQAVAFVREFGTLTRWRPVDVGARSLVGERVNPHAVDPVDVVLAHARTMSATWRLWEASKAGDLDAVDALVTWRGHPGGQRVARPADDLLAMWGGRDGEIPRGYCVDARETQSANDAALDRLDAITASVVPHARIDAALTRVAHNLGAALKNNVTVDVAMVQGGPVLRNMPSCLLAKLWLQVHAAMSSGATFPRCRGCSRLFERSSGQRGKRADAVFCSDRCKSAFQRTKNARIVELTESGMSPQQVANVVGVTVDTVARQLVKQGAPTKETKPSTTKGAKR